MPFDLVSGDAVCRVHPEMGASLSCWRIGEQRLLRDADPDALLRGDPFGMSNFPLIPFSNRIGNARFNWHGRTFRLAANAPGEPHALHGVGFEREWDVEAGAADRLTLRLDHPGDDGWPFAFTCWHDIVLTPDSLTLTLRARNDAPQAVPMGGGQHPYFDREGATLRFAADAIWEKAEDGLPRRKRDLTTNECFDPAALVEGHDLDHGYQGWGGQAEIMWTNRPWNLVMSASDTLRNVVLFIPPRREFFCLEPVSHPVDALSLGIPMHVVEPGAIWSCQTRFGATPA
ncbi:MAG: aldose 1-epimerase [Pacificimonas sp.]